MRTIETPIYRFEELKADVQMVAVINMIEEWNIDRWQIPENAIADWEEAWAEADRLQTPWFFPQILMEKCLEKIIADCKHYEYYSTGVVYGMIFENKEMAI